VLDCGDALEPSLEEVHDGVLANDRWVVRKTELRVVSQERSKEKVILGIDTIEQDAEIWVRHVNSQIKVGKHREHEPTSFCSYFRPIGRFPSIRTAG